MKQLKQTLSAAVVVLALVTGTGCAQLSPQQIDFKPSVKTENLIAGSGSVDLVVMDARVDRVIGIRGGAYAATSEITAAKPLEQVIESLAVKVMEQAGLDLTSTFAAKQMQIRLDELSYVTEKKNAGMKRTTVAARIAIEVTDGQTTYKNAYQSSQYQDTVGYPSETKNEELLNNVFNNVLNRMFSDNSLSEFLQ